MASEQRWCWNLYCTTCGHMHFQYAFHEIGNGKHPSDTDWVVRIGDTHYREQFGELPLRLNRPQELRLLWICSMANLTKVKQQCSFPDWLGYLGLVIAHTRPDSDAHWIVCASWAAQLRKWVRESTPISRRLDKVISTPGECLSIYDLESVEENFIRHLGQRASDRPRGD